MNGISFNLRQAEQETGVKSRTLQFYHQQGKLPGSFQVGKTIIVPRDTLIALTRGELEWQKNKTNG